MDGSPDQKFVRLEANPDYWRGRPKIDELQIIFYDNPAASIVGLKKGDIDLIGRLNPPDFESLKGDDNIVQWNTQGRRATYLQINHGATTSDDKPIGDGHPALKDPKVLTALHYAIDKQKLVDEVQGGLAKPADGSIIPPLYKHFFWEASGAGPDSLTPLRPLAKFFGCPGQVAEWLKAPVSKTGVPATVP